uniref:NADH dehydrogenase subunit 3 n=1 Tax=Tetrameres grusi TaxID=1911024 RepID=UPI001FCD5F4F|nr:NADH dehydrogenase subunit 3 [Tetrameres grusi]UNY39754.1 NADH dehydrogenase subunit 3 [Tetrameres grusi]
MSLYLFFFVFFLSFLVLFFMFMFCFFISFKDFFYNKVSPYECGFVSFNSCCFSYNLVFFSIVVIFVVFELEIMIFVFLVFNDVYGLLVFFLFVFYVVVSFYAEWYFGKLLWVF